MRMQTEMIQVKTIQRLLTKSTVTLRSGDGLYSIFRLLIKRSLEKAIQKAVCSKVFLMINM